MRRTVIAVLLASIAAWSMPAQAGHVGASFRHIGVKELVRYSARYLNKRIKVNGVYCYFNGPTYTCTTTEPLQIVAQRMAPGKLAKIIDTQCGGLDVIERTPICRLNIGFVPLAVSSGSGDYVLNNRLVPARMTVLSAARLLATVSR